MDYNFGFLPVKWRTPTSSGWEGEFLTLQGLYRNHHGSLSPWLGRGLVVAMQIHYSKSRTCPGAEVEEESICSAFMALVLSASRPWKIEGQVVVPPVPKPRVLIYLINLFFKLN